MEQIILPRGRTIAPINRHTMKTSNQAVELGQLLSSAIHAVVKAQEQLDQYTEMRKQAYESAAEGSLAIPPIWYTFNNVAIEMELSSSIAEVEDIHSGTKVPHIVSQTLNPTSVGLYGYQASAGLRVRIQMAPHGFVPIKNEPAISNSQDANSGQSN